MLEMRNVVKTFNKGTVDREGSARRIKPRP